jgi:hypothetical protein
VHIPVRFWPTVMVESPRSLVVFDVEGFVVGVQRLW